MEVPYPLSDVDVLAHQLQSLESDNARLRDEQARLQQGSAAASYRKLEFHAQFTPHGRCGSSTAAASGICVNKSHLVASCSWDTSTSLFDLGKWEKKGRVMIRPGQLLDTSSQCLATAFSPHNETLLGCAAYDGRVHVFHIDVGKRDVLTGHVDAVHDLAFHPSMNYLCTGSEDRKAFIWDVESKKQFRGLVQHQRGVCAVSWLGSEQPFQSGVATASLDGHVRVWDLRSPTMVVALPQGSIGRLSLACHGAKYALAVGQFCGTAHVWDLRQYREMRVLDVATASGPSDDPDEDVNVTCIALSPCGNLLTVGCSTGKVVIFDAAGICRQVIAGHTSTVLAMAWGPSWPSQWMPQAEGSTYLLTASADGTWSCWA